MSRYEEMSRGHLIRAVEAAEARAVLAEQNLHINDLTKAAAKRAVLMVFEGLTAEQVKATLGSDLAVALNLMIVEIYEKHPGGVSAGGVLIGCTSILSGYIAAVPDIEWKRDALDNLTHLLREAWGLTDGGEGSGSGVPGL